MQTRLRESHTAPFPPGPSTLEALGNLRDLGGGRDLSRVPRFFERIVAQYGNVVSWKALGRRFFFLNEPALIEEMLVTRGRDFIKGRGVQRLKRLLGEGLLTSEQPLHLRQRRMLQPAFHRERIAGYGAAMVGQTQAHTANWQPGETRALDAEMTSLTLKIAAATLFGSDVESAQAATVHDALREAMLTFPASMGAFGEALDLFPFLPVVRRFNNARARLDAVVFGMIEARRRDAGGTHDDLLAMLLAARDENGVPMDDAQIRDEAMTIFLAGHETTANALTWAWYLLTRNPGVYARMQREIDDVLGGRAATAADVALLPYTADVFAETLRLYPPAWVIGRIAARATTLGDWTIPKGAIMIASPLITQHDARWYPDPRAFRPERRQTDAAPPKSTFFAFGGGNRTCIGEPFAWMEGVLVLATIAQRFSLEAVDDVAVDTEPLVTLRPKGPVRLRISGRSVQSESGYTSGYGAGTLLR